MTLPLTVAPAQGFTSFLGFPVHTDLKTLEADVAILGIPYGAPYAMDQVANDQSRAPAAIRAQSGQISDGLDRWDFDLGGPLFDGRALRVVDCGDVPGDPADLAGTYARAQAAARAILEAGAVPITLGGDHGVPIPVFRALEGRGPVTLVHVDAHIDWRHEVGGVREGYSSPIRRASEMPWIGGIVQIGMRGSGSARPEEVHAARAYGAEIVTAYEVHEAGMGPVLARIPEGGTTYLSIDADGLDPAIMPAVAAPVPGGLLFHQVRELIHGLTAKGRVLGMDLVEVAPARDLNGISCITAGRLVLNLIGAMAHAGHFERD
jgi:agmatinase